MMRWMTLVALVAMVGYAGCGPDGGKADTPDELRFEEEDAARDDTAATDDDGLDNIDTEFDPDVWVVQSANSASAQR